MIKMTPVAAEGKSEKVLNVCFDVGKEKLDVYSRLSPVPEGLEYLNWPPRW